MYQIETHKTYTSFSVEEYSVEVETGGGGGGYKRNIVLRKCARSARFYPEEAERQRSVCWAAACVEFRKMPERVTCLQQRCVGWHCRVGNAASPGFHTRLNDSL